MIDYLIGEPLHFAMERKMMLGLKKRAETAPTRGGPAASAAKDVHRPTSRHSS